MDGEVVGRRHIMSKLKPKSLCDGACSGDSEENA